MRDQPIAVFLNLSSKEEPLK